MHLKKKDHWKFAAEKIHLQMHENGRPTLRYTISLDGNAIAIFKSHRTRSVHFDRDCQCNCKWLLTKRLRSPLLCVQTSRDLCIFGGIYISVRVFWHVIYEWTIELTVIDAHDEWKHKNMPKRNRELKPASKREWEEKQKKYLEHVLKRAFCLTISFFFLHYSRVTVKFYWNDKYCEFIAQLSFATIWMRQHEKWALVYGHFKKKEKKLFALSTKNITPIYIINSH